MNPATAAQIAALLTLGIRLWGRFENLENLLAMAAKHDYGFKSLDELTTRQMSKMIAKMQRTLELPRNWGH